jgi:uncharacterized protein (DUF4415 family)
MEEREYDFSKADQGAVSPKAAGKSRITIRLDADILHWFRQGVHDSGGGNYQTLINEALREHVQLREGTLERTLRKVIREELHSAGR